ncbi:MAG: diguanylate cyclase (GGDEF)-like protein/PAS domain S-box-containing protein [Nonlabens sp.]|jgi:diguanylate cyclase (GGDEF)-like protein/PAS domain S-box-containing protein
MSKTSELEQQRFELVVNAAELGVWDINIVTGDLYFNDHCAYMLGFEPSEVKGMKIMEWLKFLHPEDLQSTAKLFQDKRKDTTELYELELRIKHKDGHYIWILTTGKFTEWNRHGFPKRMMGTHLNISERKDAENKLIAVSDLLDKSQRVAKVGGWQFDLTSKVVSWTDEVYRIHELTKAEFEPTIKAGFFYLTKESKAIAQSAFVKAINDQVGFDIELKSTTASGKTIDVRVTCDVHCRKGRVSTMDGIIQDITDQKRIHKNLESANESLKLSAHFDPLTGLANRNLLSDRMNQSLARCDRKGDNTVIAFIDMDGFKDINDKYGHSFGDDVLRNIADKLSGIMRTCDTVARLGGDEFVMILDELADPGMCEPILQRVLDSLKGVSFVNNKKVELSASIGVTIYPQDNSSADQLIRHADQAMYIAKKQGKNCFHIFDTIKDEAEKNQNEELKAIGTALDNEEFLLFYQPKMNMRTNQIIGLEALIRWDHPERGILAPFFFLPAVENDRLGIDIGEWVIKTALSQLKTWSEQGINLTLSVNISPLQLQDVNFVSRVKDILSQFPNFKKGSLEFEILETSALDQVDQVTEVINECRSLGISLSIDDFGTGYSSMSYLKRLPTEYLKIDQSFIRDMLNNKEDSAIVSGIVGLGKAFERKVIAEGVETIEHGEKLLTLNCYLVQGYGIARPMPSGEFPGWLKNWKQGNEWERLSTIRDISKSA